MASPYNPAPIPEGELRGQAFGGGTARRHDAVLHWRGAAGTLRAADGAILATGKVLRREALGRSGVLIALEGGWTFEAEGEALAAQAAQLPGPAPAGWIERLERAAPSRLVLFALAALAGVYMVWRWGIDVLVSLAIFATPPAMLGGIDRSQMAIIDSVMADETQLSAAEQAKVRQVYGKLTALAPPPKSGAFTLEFRNMGEEIGPNAFALPGGTMVVTDQIVRDFPDENVLAGVLGHEIAHVTQDHGLRQLYRALSSYVLVVLIVGDAGSVLEDILLEGNAVLALRYSRGAEAEADRLGVALANQAGYDGRALARFFTALSGRFGGEEGPNWLSTHPDSTARAEEIKAMPAP